MVASNFVEFLVKPASKVSGGLVIEVAAEADLLRQLGGLRHLIPEHELGGLQGNVFPVVQKLQTIVDDSPESPVKARNIGRVPGNHTG